MSSVHDLWLAKGSQVKESVMSCLLRSFVAYFGEYTVLESLLLYSFMSTIDNFDWTRCGCARKVSSGWWHAQLPRDSIAEVCVGGWSFQLA
jgi:hypothetical protein